MKVYVCLYFVVERYFYELNNMKPLGKLLAARKVRIHFYVELFTYLNNGGKVCYRHKYA